MFVGAHLAADTVWADSFPLLSPQGIGGLTVASSVVSGDFNGDGILDLAAVSSASSEVIWIQSTGAGFVGHTVTNALSGPIDLAAGDLDCDGDLDLAIAVYGAGRVVWARNLGGGSWDLGGTVTNAAPHIRSIELLDLEPDGDLDVVGAIPDTDEIVRWRSNGCPGTVWTATAIVTGIDQPLDVAVGDLSGDGLTDVVSIDHTTGLVAYWTNPGAAGAWTQVTLEGAWDGATSVSVGDIDGDGDLDVAGAADGADEIAWWENPGGAGAWSDHLVASFLFASLIRMGDLDRDGDLDLLAGSFSPPYGARIFENADGSGLDWNLQQLDEVLVPKDLIAGDFDDDGDVDVVAATTTLGVAVYKNDSPRFSALFAPQDNWASNTTFEIVDVATGDLDGDGRLDVVFAERDPVNSVGHVSWYRNVGPVPAGGSSFAFANFPMVAIGRSSRSRSATSMRTVTRT